MNMVQFGVLLTAVVLTTLATQSKGHLVPKKWGYRMKRCEKSLVDYLKFYCNNDMRFKHKFHGFPFLTESARGLKNGKKIFLMQNDAYEFTANYCCYPEGHGCGAHEYDDLCTYNDDWKECQRNGTGYEECFGEYNDKKSVADRVRYIKNYRFYEEQLSAMESSLLEERCSCWDLPY